MSSFENKIRICAICGASVNCTILMSTNTFGGSPDLDLRPAEMQRSTMDAWLDECPSCHYIAPNISEATDEVKKAAQSPEYRNYNSNAKLPALANRFIRYSLLQSKDSESCGLAKLNAAWVCDDENLPGSASILRSQAAKELLKVQFFEDDRHQMTIGAILVDILRRSKSFDEALRLIDELSELSAVKTDEVFQKMLLYQKRLCELKDIDCHLVSDAQKIG